LEISKQTRKSRILSVVFYSDRGLCVELGAEKLDNDGIYGYSPTEDFVKALEKEIAFQIENAISGRRTHSTLRNVHKRFQRATAHYKECGQ